MPNEYSPFDKDIKDLQPEDLSAQRSVHEGWYVECKREEITASAMAKALSAFANTFGGWLFPGPFRQPSWWNSHGGPIVRSDRRFRSCAGTAQSGRCSTTLRRSLAPALRRRAMGSRRFQRH